MFLLFSEDGIGRVSLERPGLSGDMRVCGKPVPYRIETWMTAGGFKSVTGSITGEPAFLYALLPAAEVYLTGRSGETMRIEMTDIDDGRGNFRLPRGLAGV